jgi:alkylation response protein AidB-like acyl-CoA dehydrogenase
MNFDFSDESNQLRDQARRFLAEHAGPKQVRAVLEGAAPDDAALWRGIAEMGWLGAAIPEPYGGAGLGHEALCVLAEEIGRATAPVPFSSSIYLAAEALVLAGSPAQRTAWLPKLATGEAIGTLAWAEGPGNPSTDRLTTRFEARRLTGTKLPVPDGSIADLAVVAAHDPTGALVLVLVDLSAPGVTRETLATLDPTRNQARLSFDRAPAEALPGAGRAELHRILNGAAVLLAFEQLGGATACLEMAVAFAKERYAFGRPIGSFQAIKHKLADVYVANELARSNAYYGCWALATNAAELPLAAATARVSATEAFHLAAKENIQTHGGMGFTWAADCHLFYRRAKLLGLCLGAAPLWKQRVVAELEARNAA